MSANFCAMHGLCTTIKTIEGNQLTLSDNAVELNLCNVLSSAPNKYTRLMLSTGVGYEEFQVTCTNGCLKLSSNPVANFVAGDKVWYESCSQANLEDTINCINTEGEDGTEAEDFPKLPGYDLEQNDQGEWCYVAEGDQQKKVSWQDGKNLLTMNENGIITCEPAPAGSFPMEGEYVYATVTVGSDCKVSSVKQGSKPVSGSCGSGCCGNCAQEVTQAEIA